jgi:hypothetical protein
MIAGNKFGHTDTVMGGSCSVPHNISADVVQVWLESRDISLLCDGDVGVVEKRYGLPFRGAAMIVRCADGTWGVSNDMIRVEGEGW